MAAPILKTKNDIIQIHRYTIDIKNDVGKGAYGIVYTGKDDKDRLVAAKKIDGKQHPRILSQKLNRLLRLNHPNIISIYDVHQEDNIFWMFMHYCTHGDLGKFCRGKTLTRDQKFEIMNGIARGVCYLHENDIIHRDIKPPNILIAHDSPVVAKLADFDFSKCLDPEVESSVMSSNVGTWAYKAPEFFNRTEGQIRYHRNVDVYACGLTFLAIDQATDGKKKLVPRIGTPQDMSELHAPSIGQLIAERIKYGVEELDIVVIDQSTSCEETELKKLIQRMTCVDPKERLSAAQVLQFLELITSGVLLDFSHLDRRQGGLTYFNDLLTRSTSGLGSHTGSSALNSHPTLGNRLLGLLLGTTSLLNLPQRTRPGLRSQENQTTSHQSAIGTRLHSQQGSHGLKEDQNAFLQHHIIPEDLPEEPTKMKVSG